MKIDWWAIVVIVLIVAVAVTVGMSIVKYEPYPTCAEDVVLVGKGNFIQGRWTYYVCGPALDDWGCP